MSVKELAISPELLTLRRQHLSSSAHDKTPQAGGLSDRKSSRMVLEAASQGRAPGVAAPWPAHVAFTRAQTSGVLPCPEGSISAGSELCPRDARAPRSLRKGAACSRRVRGGAVPSGSGRAQLSARTALIPRAGHGGSVRMALPPRPTLPLQLCP